ncbi:MAG: fatty acid desaturase [Patulibacter sp.]|nr:fatty acid desaturase [Patulibacter sp.]MDO9407857.1 fatty acid desaturase [Patulibacter sp.]
MSTPTATPPANAFDDDDFKAVPKSDRPLSPKAPDRESRPAGHSRATASTDVAVAEPGSDTSRTPGPLHAVPHMSQDMLDAFGREMEAIRKKHMDDRGERDATYIRSIIKAQRRLEVGGRALLEFAWVPPFWVAGVAALSASKILDNMEIGHNVMHGQYDWMQDDELNGRTFEWDTACPADQWRHSHNYMHHTHTNIVGKDRDIGYGILRMSEDQPWEPYFLGNLGYVSALALLFEYGVAVHDLETEELRTGTWNLRERLPMLKAIYDKVKGQAAKDYVLFPLLAGPGAPATLSANVTANIIRNLWTFSIIFCGHFPDGVEEFTEEETADETRGGWYVRQLLGSANLTGGKLFHIMSGNLSFQIEHHLFPDVPAHRYAEISVDVKEACERYGLDYHAGPLPYQLFTVFRKIAKLSVPSAPELQDYLDRPSSSRVGKVAGRLVGGATGVVRGAGGVAKGVVGTVPGVRRATAA